MRKFTERVVDQRIGAWMRETRQSHGYSLQEVAALIGVTYQQVQKYEQGTNRLSVVRLLAFAHAVGIDPAALLKHIGQESLPAPEARTAYRAAQIARQIENESVCCKWLDIGRSLI